MRRESVFVEVSVTFEVLKELLEEWRAGVLLRNHKMLVFINDEKGKKVCNLKGSDGRRWKEFITHADDFALQLSC